MIKALVAIAAAVAMFGASIADASPGRTNSSGCHKPKRGGYHCHSTKKHTVQRAPGVAPAPKPAKPVKAPKRPA